jgi:CelD/BcsL family acetyltransferase involved in cellulose biosynthesis
MRFFVQRITDFAELEPLASEWEELEKLSSPRTPFTSPLWNQLWWLHFKEDRLLVRDELFVLSLRDAQGRLIALAPLMRTMRPAKGPLRIREIHFFGADPNITELRGVACRPEHRAGALQTLHAYLMEHGGEWDSLHWCGIPADNPVESLRAALPYRTVRDYYLRLPGSWPELIAGLSRNMKEALRKCYNSLKRGGHAFTFRAVDKPEEVAAALDIFFKLHRARAELDGAVPHADIFKSERSRSFLREYANRMAQRDQLRIFQLIIDGNVVATRIGFLFGEEMYLYYSGYSPQWRKFSAMTTLTVESIKWALQRQFKIVNMSTGSDHSKVRWQPIETVSKEYVLQSPMVQTRHVLNNIVHLLRHVPPRSMLGRMVAIARRRR